MRKKAALMIKAIITMILLLVMFIKTNVTDVIAISSTIHLSWLLIAIIFTFIQPWINAIRWHYILQFVGVRQTLIYSLQIFWIGMFFNSFLPAGFGGDAMRVWMLKKNGVSASTVLSSVFLDRLFGLFLLVILVCIFLPKISQIIDNHRVTYFFYFTLIGVLAGLFSLAHLNRLPINWNQYRITRILNQISSDIRLISSSFLKLSLLILIAFLGLIFQILTVYILSCSLNLHLPIIYFFEFIPLVILLMTLPISIGGWGIREGAIVTFFGYVGVSTTSALMLSILYGCVTLLSTLPGAVIWLRKKHHLHLVKTNLCDKVPAVFTKNQTSSS